MLTKLRFAEKDSSPMKAGEADDARRLLVGGLTTGFLAALASPVLAQQETKDDRKHGGLLEHSHSTDQSTTGAHLKPPVRELSYTQNMEDFHLSLAFAGKENGTYIDIGGGHPIAGSVSFWFYERGWRGVVVEPQAKLASLHRRLRTRDTFVQAVVGHDAADVELYEVDRLHGLSTTVKHYAEAAAKHQASHRTVRVPSLSLAELCRRHAPAGNIDFLKIDVEGAEHEVIRGGDWQRDRPAVVVVESVTPDTNEPSWQPWEPILLTHGYRLALFDSLNRFYVADECSDILARFPKTRAPWEAVVHMYEIGRALESANHPEHQLATKLAHAFLASLPHLTDDAIKALLTSNNGSLASVHETPSIDTETFRLALGRIACGYDGGQLHEEPS